MRRSVATVVPRRHFLPCGTDSDAQANILLCRKDSIAPTTPNAVSMRQQCTCDDSYHDGLHRQLYRRLHGGCTGGTVGQPLPDPTRVPGSCTLLLWLCRCKLPGPNHGQRVATWHWIVICSPTMYSVFPPLPCNKASATLPKVSVRLQIAQA